MLAGFVCVSYFYENIYIWLVEVVFWRTEADSVSYTFQKVSLGRESINLAYIKDKQCSCFANERSTAGLPAEWCLAPVWEVCVSQCEVPCEKWHVGFVWDCKRVVSGTFMSRLFFLSDWTEQQTLGFIKRYCVNAINRFAVWNPLS